MVAHAWGVLPSELMARPIDEVDVMYVYLDLLAETQNARSDQI